MIPAFNPLAGFSPNWAAVLVQIEHCADAVFKKAKAHDRPIRIMKIFFFI